MERLRKGVCEGRGGERELARARTRVRKREA